MPRVSVLLAALLLYPSCALCFADKYTSVRSAAYWQDSVTTSIPPGSLVAPFDLQVHFEQLAKGVATSKQTWQLFSGVYVMPQQVAGINLSAEVRLLGAGTQATTILFQGHTRMLVLQALSSITFENATLRGVVDGALIGSRDKSLSNEELPRVYVGGCEWLVADSDLAGSPPGGYLTNHLRAAFDSGQMVALSTAPNVTQNQTFKGFQPVTAIEYAPDAITFGGPFLFRRSTRARNTGAVFLYLTDVRQASSPGSEMQALFDALVTQFGGPTTDCWDSRYAVAGFTYRGTVNVTKSGFPCKSWDDPSTFPSAFLPAAGGFSSVEGNYCRNPRLTPDGPWCFTTNPSIISADGAQALEACDIPACPRSGPEGALPPPAPPPGQVVVVRTSSGLLIAAIAVSGTLLLAVLICCMLCLRNREGVKLSQTWLAARTGRTSEDKYSLVVDMDALRPWHVQETFETTRREPPSHMRDRLVLDGGEVALDVLARQAALMVEECPAADSLLVPALEYKYGRAWVNENRIDASRLLGEGGIGKVYAGVHCGRPAAFKVINQLKTPDAMVRFARKCVLPLVHLQLQPSFPVDHPHLLQLDDCLMFPPYYSLIALKRSSPEASRALAVSTALLNFVPPAGTSGGLSEQLPMPPMRPPPPPPAVLEIPEIPEPATPLSPPGKAKTPTRPRKLRFVMSVRKRGWPFLTSPKAPSTAADSVPSPATMPATPDSVVPGAPATAIDQENLVYSLAGEETVMYASKDPGGGPSSSHPGGADVLQPVDENSQRSSVSLPRPPTSLFGALTAGQLRRRTREATTEGGMPTPEGAAVGRSAAGPDRDIVAQVIMVSPLCELGTLTELLRGITQIPVRLLPQELKTALKLDTSLGDAQGSTADTVTINDMPAIWALVLKLQLALQVVAGMCALHAARLVHCDIKLDNVFLTEDRSYEPFGICCKLGDLDTCRSLEGGHLSTAPSPSTAAVDPLELKPFHLPARGSDSSKLGSMPPWVGAGIHFTSCMKGTPGYLAPEMIMHGSVSTETDMFSLSVTLSIMFAHRSEFLNPHELHMRLVAEFPTYLDPALAECLLDGRSAEPVLRPPPVKLRAALEAQLAGCQQALRIVRPWGGVAQQAASRRA